MADDILKRHGKLTNGMMPAETPSPAAVEERARDLAEIDGRDRNAVTNTDRERALSELEGRSTLERDSEGDTAREGYDARDPSDPAGGQKERKPKYPASDESQQAREAVLEGVEEAEHEQMMQSRRDRDRTLEQ